MSSTDTPQISFDKFTNIIDGKPRGAKESYKGINPSTGEELWDVPISTQQDVDDAVVSAEKAFESWRRVPFEERKRYLQKYLDLYHTYSEPMTDLVAKETGKPRQFAVFEVQGVAWFFAHHLTLQIPSEHLEDDEKVVTTRYAPMGVVAAIGPWNYPLILMFGKILPALLTGCTILCKPSPFTPYSLLKAVEIAQSIFPPGVIQVLGGDDKLGPMLTNHPHIRMISFTGSIATGKKIMESCSKTLKRCVLELGGNNASIVLPDVDIEKTAPELVMGAFINSGQVCVATKRIYIHEKIYKEMLAAMVKAAEKLIVGSPDDKGVIVGPVQNAMQYERVKGFVADCKANNYNFVTGSPEVANGKGYFIRPTIIDNPPNDSRIIAEEPFGPIVPTQPWSDEDEVIDRTNNTNTGLGACVWSNDVAAAERIAMRLDVGSVWINSWEKLTPQAFFGGHKESGIGGEWGTRGLFSYCLPHVIHNYKIKA